MVPYETVNIFFIPSVYSFHFNIPVQCMALWNIPINSAISYQARFSLLLCPCFHFPFFCSNRNTVQQTQKGTAREPNISSYLMDKSVFSKTNQALVSFLLLPVLVPACLILVQQSISKLCMRKIKRQFVLSQKT